MRIFLFLLILLPFVANAQNTIDQDGWKSIDSGMSYEDLIDAVKNATEGGGMFVVTEAGPTEAAEKRGVDILGNCVIGIFNNDYAVRILGLSKAAMIEAPMRLYVTENEDETATLSWKVPTFILEPYMEEGGEQLRKIAEELDANFSAIAQDAVSE